MKLKGIFRAVATVTLISVITRFLSFVFRVYLSRRLGAEVLGLYQITTSIFMLFVCFSSSGLPVTLSRKTAQYDAIGDFNKSKSIFTTSLILSLVISVVTCGVFLIFPNITALLFTDSRCNEIFIILLPSLISTSIYCTTRAWFWGKKQYGIYSSTEMFEELLKIILTASFITLPIISCSIGAKVAWAYVIGDVVIAIVLIFLYFRKGGSLAKPQYLGEVAKSAAPLTTTRIFGSLISSAMALLLPAMLVKYGMDTQAATSEFGRISGMVMPLILCPGTVVGALAVVLVPELATSNSDKNYTSTHYKISKAMLFSAAITACCLTVFMSCGDEIGLLLYKDAAAGKMLEASAILMVPLVLNQLSATILNSLGKESYTFLSHIIGSIGLLITILVLPKYIGIMAYPCGLFVFHSINLVLNTIKIRRTTNISLSYLLDSFILMAAGFLAKFVGDGVRIATSGLPTVATIVLSSLSSLAVLGIIILVIYRLFRKQNKANQCANSLIK